MALLTSAVANRAIGFSKLSGNVQATVMVLSVSKVLSTEGAGSAAI